MSTKNYFKISPTTIRLALSIILLAIALATQTIGNNDFAY